MSGLLGPAVPAATSRPLVDSREVDALIAVLPGVRDLGGINAWSDGLRVLARRRAVRALRLAAGRCRRG